MAASDSASRFTALLQGPLDRELARWLYPSGTRADDFAAPAGEPALVPAHSVSWQVFKNPVSLFVGGVAAVVLELAEPRVRAGVWQHTSFRREPLQRLQRTGYAAMLTVYGARSRAEALIARVVRGHERVRGLTDDGRSYAANNPELLRWVQATAAFGFLEAYAACVRPLSPDARDRFYAEGQPAARLYGAHDAPASQAQREALFDRMAPLLEPSDVIGEFLGLMARVEVLPGPLRGFQRVLLRAAVALLPLALREQLRLDRAWALLPWQARVVRQIGIWADGLALPSHPAVQACCRLGLPRDLLFRPPR
jgi:uncharacterized protein (DUF2236 family)